MSAYEHGLGKSHECSACGGMGWEWGGSYEDWTRCPVCLGAVRISDVMPNADALADAETLHKVARELSPRGYWRSSLAYASRCTWMGLSYWRSRGKQADEFLAVPFARKAAHAALRAVPGLRGDATNSRCERAKA